MREDIAIKADRQSYLEAVLATLPECVAIVDTDLRIIDVNASGLEMLGAKSIDDLPHAAPLSLISDKNQPAFRRAFEAELNSKENKSSQPVRLELNALDGVLYQLECRFAPLADANGEIGRCDHLPRRNRMVSDIGRFGAIELHTALHSRHSS